MAIILNDNLQVENSKPIDARYYSISQVPYIDVNEVFTQLPAFKRYIGQIVNISNIEYVFKNGIADVDLVVNSANVIVDLGYTPENISNKAENFNIKNDTKYPTTLAVSDYFDQLMNGLSWKFSVTCATAVALPSCTLDFTGLLITADSNGALPLIDGYDTTIDDGIVVRILIKNEANQLKNGIWRIANQGDAGSQFVLVRTDDCNSSLELAHATMLVRNGVVEKNRVYTLSYPSNDYTVPIGTVNIAAALVNSANTYIAGNGITLTGNSFSVEPNSITNNMLSGGIDLTTKVVGVLPSSKGGTGVSNNPAFTITLGGVLATSNNVNLGSLNHSLTLNTTASTNVTLPTTGTLATLSGIETLTNKTLTSPKIASIKGTLTAGTDGATITFDKNTSDFHNVILGGNRILALSNMEAGDRIVLRLVQDATGSRSVTWFTTIKWAGGVAPTLTSTANKADVFGFLCTSSGNYDGFVIGQNI